MKLKSCSFGAVLIAALFLTINPTTVSAQNTVFTYQGCVTDHGTNFTGAGQFQFALVTSDNSNQQATAKANLSGESVTSYTMTAEGSGYTTAPTVNIFGGGGSGATATAALSDGAIISLIPQTAGTGYTSEPSVLIGPPPSAFSYITYWSNDGTSVKGSEPEASVAVGVTNGLFTVVLGNTTQPNMEAIPATLFSISNLQLRIWFNDGASGFAALDPAQSLTPTPYAVTALSILGIQTQQNTSGAPNVIGGASDNYVSNNVIGATIGGGGANNYDGHVLSNSVTADFGTIGGGAANTASGQFGTVGGGYTNITSGNYATIGGGSYNTANETFATVGGGNGNTNNGYAATVGGGSDNAASSNFSTIGGGDDNIVSANEATVGGGSGNLAGGGDATVSGGGGNIATNSFATVGGGTGNIASGYGATASGGLGNTVSNSYATVSGGYGNIASGAGSFVGGRGYSSSYLEPNIASGSNSVVCGGLGNTASGSATTVVGGYLNTASATNSLAAGANAKAINTGAFVWGDNSGSTTTSTTTNSVTMRASGGFRFFTSSGTAGAQLEAGATSWTTLSDRNAKKNFQSVDYQEILNKLATVPIEQWNYKWENDSDTPNIGPMAQDFIHAFYPGRNDKGITTLEFDGVELAAIQGLNEKLKEKDADIENLQKQLNDLKAMVKQLAKAKQASE